MKERIQASIWCAVIVGLVAQLAATPVSNAQTNVVDADKPSIARAFRNILKRTDDIDAYTARVDLLFMKRYDRDGDGLDRRDVENFQQERDTHWRWRAIGQVMTFDLNDDLVVTRAEIESSLFGSRTDSQQHVRSLLRRFDTNGDQSITFEEVRRTPLEIRRDTILEELLSLDPNHDEVLTEVELNALAASAYQRLVREREQRRQKSFKPQALPKGFFESRPERKQTRCTVPDVPSEAEFVVFGGYEGDAISSASIGGPEQETNLINVFIEPGAKPLYVVLTSYESMVWRFSGAVDRVTRVVVSSSATGLPKKAGENVGGRPSASGVVGVDENKVAITSISCPNYFYKTEAARLNDDIAQIFGRTPDAILGSYSASQVSIPSGEIVRVKKGSPPLPEGFDAVMWKEASRYWPAGLVNVEPKGVVAVERVETYEVLPSQMGLAQLVGSGAIERIGGNKFRLVRPIAHMPPGMGGAHSILLFVAEGVPVPPGDPVHTCVVQEGKELTKISRGPCFSY